MSRLDQNIRKTEEVPSLVLQQFKGLSLKLDFTNRDKSSFQQLDNFDLYIPGSIRKILPATLYGGPYGANLLNASEYLAQANNPAGGIRRIIGVGADGKLYDTTTAALYSDTSALLGVPVTIPTILQYPGFFLPYNIRSWQKNTMYNLHDAVIEYGTDGNIYVFEVTSIGTSGNIEPIWPTSGTILDGSTLAPTFNTTVGGTTNDGTAVWTCKGHSPWVASAGHVVGDYIIDSNGNIQAVIQTNPPATSGTSPPSWANNFGDSTIDGGTLVLIPNVIYTPNVVWQCLLAPGWIVNHSYSLGNAIVDPNGNIQVITTAGRTGSGVTLIWTNRGIPNSSRFFAYFLSIVSKGKQPIRVVEWQYDPTSIVESPKMTIGQMGVSMPEMPIELGGFSVTPNLNGYSPSAGRFYLWTLYNPNTLQESSPSPFVGQTKITKVDAGGVTVTINGSLLQPLPIPPTPATGNKQPVFSSYQNYYMAIPLSVLTPSIGQGYSTIRVYATKDGGQNFFLVNTLFDDQGNQISNSDGSIPITLLTTLQAVRGWTDYYPLPESQMLVPSVRVYEGSGAINLVPDPINLGAAAWSATTPGPATNAIYVAIGGAPDGSNSFQIDGPNTTKNVWKSANIAVKSQPYYFQMFLDKSSGTGGTMKVVVQTPGGGALLTLTQSDSTASTLMGTFTPNAGQRRVQIVVYVQGVTIAADTSLVWADPLLQVGTTFNATPVNYPTTDASLLLPAPTAFSNNPPPIARAAELFNDAMFFVDDVDPTKIEYSQQGKYESVGLNNFVRSSTKQGSAILELTKTFNRLMVTKERSIEQITSYPPGEPAAVDPQHGVLSYRSSVPYGTDLFSLMTHGLGKLGPNQAVTEAGTIDVAFNALLVGDDIKPLIDSINASTLRAQNITTKMPCPAILNNQDLYLLAYAVGNGFNDNVLLRYMGRTEGFSRMTALPNGQQIITIREIQLPNGQTAIMALCADSKSYLLFNGTQDGTITAIAVTQPLPTPQDLSQELIDTRKNFRSLVFEGVGLDSFDVYAATDVQFNPDGTATTFPWGPNRIINNEVDLGFPAKQVVIKIVNARSSPVTPVISYINLNYDIEGEAA